VTQRVALITGSAGGIGRATVAAFQRAGWSVIGLDRDEDRLSDRWIRADLADADILEAAITSLPDLEGLDALVNNAAELIPGSVTDASLEHWDRTMAVNVRSAFLATKLAHRLLLRRSGAIVNVASVHALATSRGVASYAASKGALVALTRASALDLSAAGIRVNAVLPGAVDTPMLLGSLDREPRATAMADLASRTPLGRVGNPEDIAEAILFLADRDRSSFITGQLLVVDGGAMVRLSTE
jgi:glucose 1-dehydrogenase